MTSLKFFGWFLFLLLIAFPLFSSINLAYGEYKEMNIKIVVLPNKARVIEEINPRTIVSTINIQAISQKISHILATDEKSTVLVTSENQNAIRIDTLGASHVILTYDADIVNNNSGVSTVDYNSTNLESTVVLPPGSDIVSVNNIPNDIKDGTITMPVGHTTISYVVRTVNQNNFMATTNGTKYLVGVITASKIEKFGFDVSSKSLSMNIDNQAPVLVIIPKSLLVGPYDVQLNGKPMQSKEYYQNSTHAWIRIDPSESGDIKISSSSATIPEFFSISLFVLIVAMMPGLIFRKKIFQYSF
jgi:hypothetical protein